MPFSFGANADGQMYIAYTGPVMKQDSIAVVLQ